MALESYVMFRCLERVWSSRCRPRLKWPKWVRYEKRDQGVVEDGGVSVGGGARACAARENRQWEDWADPNHRSFDICTGWQSDEMTSVSRYVHGLEILSRLANSWSNAMFSICRFMEMTRPWPGV